ncbi:MAG TPA: TonB-dependent receptor [Flavitalea sp.]|nr:TonB-dependent receptor [Flavitalea sp.]
MSKKQFACMLLVIFSSGYLLAQDDSIFTKPLEEVTVTANKFPTKTLQTGKVLTIISRQQLERAGGKDLSQILHEQAGLYLNGANSNPGKDKTIFLRGAKGEHTLIAIDGVPVYDVSGVTSSFDIRSIPIENIERIEILKGSQSTLYGSDAVAGVINIIMKKGTKKASPSLLLSYGSYNTFKANASINGRSGAVDYQAGYTYSKTDGISEATDKNVSGSFDKDGATQKSFMTGIGISISKNIRVNPYLLLSNFDGDLDNGGFSDDKDYSQKLKNFQAGIRNELTFGKTKVNLLYNYNRVRRDYFNDSSIKETPLDGYLKGNYEGSEHFADAYVHFPLIPDLSFIGGIDYRSSGTSIETFGIYKYEFGGTIYSDSYSSKLGKDSAKQNQTGIYGAVVYRSKQGLNVEAGGRFNNHSTYGSNFVFNFNPSYIIQKNFKLFGNISSAYRVPTLYQLFSEYRNTFENLQPEKAITYEGGVHILSQRNLYNVRLAVFKRDVTDGIAFYTDPSTFQSYYVNQDKQEDWGFEIEPTVNIGNTVQLIVTYSYVDGKITTPGSVKDTSFFNLIRRPKHIFSATANYQVTKQLFVSGQLRNFGKRTDLDFSSFPAKTVSLSSYTLLDLYVEYKFKKFIKLFASGRNLANVSYSEALGFNALDRNFSAGVLFKL